MKLIIFVVIFVAIILLINNYSKCLNEKFTDLPSAFDEMNEFSLLNVEKIGPLYIDGNTMAAPPVDPVDMNIYKDKPWEMKENSDFGNIFNDDMGNNKITDRNQFNPMIEYTLPSIVKNTDVARPRILPPNATIAPKNLKFEKELPKSGSFPPEINVGTQNIPTIYRFLGYAINQYYSQYYLIYENEVTDKIDNKMVNNDLKYLDFKLYQYVLVKMKNNTPYVLHKVGPRVKININDIVYLSYGVFELGPLQITSINNYQ
jgi:hypothetical protein